MLSKEFLLSQKQCCHLECTNCPYIKILFIVNPDYSEYQNVAEKFKFIIEEDGHEVILAYDTNYNGDNFDMIIVDKIKTDGIIGVDAKVNHLCKLVYNKVKNLHE